MSCLDREGAGAAQSPFLLPQLYLNHDVFLQRTDPSMLLHAGVGHGGGRCRCPSRLGSHSCATSLQVLRVWAGVTRLPPFLRLCPGGGHPPGRAGRGEDPPHGRRG